MVRDHSWDLTLSEHEMFFLLFKEYMITTKHYGLQTVLLKKRNVFV